MTILEQLEPDSIFFQAYQERWFCNIEWQLQTILKCGV
jgi:hypothetical protein